ncbi:MAG: M6 family metalloprotease domain-containing protein [Candidatus Symbiothrix sp.]|nr:M6 family metalloprotease domain-containing protein [Candidatus Symbiothrix sp.]
MKKTLLCMLFTAFLFATHQAMAVPAYPYPIQYKQPDGSTLTITLKGDERVHWATTFEGYTLLVNKSGFYEYAQKEASGDLTLSGIRVHNVDKQTAEEKTFLRTAEKDLRYSREQVNLLEQVWKTQEPGRQKSLSAANRASYAPATGTVRAPLVLVGFQGKPFTKTKADFEMLMNQPNYTAGGTIPGSVRDYFYDNSYEQLTYQVDVFGPYTLSQSISFYDEEYGEPRAMTYEAANMAHADGCNFADYDRDNDGYVDGIHIIFAGYGKEAGAPAGDAIWSHAWELFGEYALQLDGKQVFRYSCSPELRNTYGSNITYIGVIAHELSHVFGIPDFYDTNYSTQGQSLDTESWDIMAHGSWNDQGRTPANHTAWSKDFLGWVPAVELTSEANITLPDPATQGAVYKINTTTPNEYFLIENRQKQGWDAYIPSSGMLIYHADENYSGWNSNCINCVSSHRGLYIKQAGGGANSDNSDRTTDPYPSGENTSFTDTSVPNSKSWAGATTDQPVTRITHNTTDRTVSFRFMENPDDFDAALTQFVNLPAKSYQAGERDIKVKLENWGRAFTSATITWSIDNQEQTTRQWTGSLTYNKKDTVTLGVADLPVGIHTISATVTLANDIDVTNNTLDATIEIKAAETLPYATEFNGSLDGWESVSFDGDLHWQWSDALNYYTFMEINTTTRANGYALYGLTADGIHTGPNPARSALVSPGFDFSNVENAIDLSFEYNVMMYYTQTTLKVQASTDNFQNQTVDLWSQTLSNTWESVSGAPVIDLSAFAGESNVRVRFLYNGGLGLAWAIDDIKISENNDPRLKTLTVSSGELSPLFNPATTNYTVNVFNDVSSIDITATALRPTDIILGTGTKSLVEGNNTFNIVVTNQGGNDLKIYTILVKRMNPALIVPFVEDFESTTPSWKMANGTQLDRWVIGDATSASGTKSAYISNGNGSSYSRVYLYTDVYFTPDTDASHIYQLSFDWKKWGDSWNNYLAVYLMDTDIEPIAGQSLYNANYLGEFNNASTWQKAIINLSDSYYYTLKGETKRLVFAWTNYGDSGTELPAAIDNVTIRSIDPNEALLINLSVSEGVLSPSFDPKTFDYTLKVNNNVNSISIYATPVRAIDTVTGTGVKSLEVGDNPVEIVVSNPEGTVQNTYKIVVKRLGPPLNVPFIEDFESVAPSWTLANGSQPNQWVIGTATAASGSKSAYISDDGGISNHYNSANYSRVYLYSDVYFTPLSDDFTLYRLSFDWKGMGESWCDYLTVYLIDTDTEPIAGDYLYYATELGQFYNADTWQKCDLQFSGDYSNTTKRLVFAWVNDGSWGNQPPIAIDNVVIRAFDSDEALLSDLSVSEGVLSPSFDANTFSYTVKVANDINRIDLSATTARAVDTVTGTGAQSLEVGENIFEIVVSNPEGTFYNSYKVLVERMKPAFQAPFVEDFETENAYWQFANGAEPNQWYIGTATAASGTKSAYISDDGGVSNHYNTSQWGLSYFYTDIYFTPSSDNSHIFLSFDWKESGEFWCDYLTVYLTDTDTEPIAGQYLYNGIILGEFQNTSTWQKAVINLSEIYYSPLSGDIKRLVFGWRNDASLGNQPAAAIDNISIEYKTMDETDATLSSLTVSHGVLSPSFEPTVFNYTVDVANDVSSMKLYATPAHPMAVVIGAGEFSLKVGENTRTMEVRAADHTHKNVYTVKVNRDAGVGIEKPETQVSVYPNPTTGKVYIKNAEGAEISVYNLPGTELLRTRESSIDLSGYPKGIYLLRVGGKTVKIVKD